MTEPLEKIRDDIQDRAKDGRFNNLIALFVTVVATFMALCSVKDGNVLQAMQRSQATAIEQWTLHESRSVQQRLARASIGSLQAQLALDPGASPGVRSEVEAEIEAQRAEVAGYEREKEQFRDRAKAWDQNYDAMNYRDDQFDLAEACLSASVALAGVAALTKKRWLFAVAFALGCVGVVFGLAGFLHLELHSSLMARILG